MTVLEDVKTVVQRWADSVKGLGGILTVPFTPNKTFKGATKSFGREVQGAVAETLEGPVIILAAASLWTLGPRESDKSSPRRFGEGLALGTLFYALVYGARRWVL